MQTGRLGNLLKIVGATMSMTRMVWLAALTFFASVTVGGTASTQQRASVRIDGQVQAGGGPLANSIVTLWGAGAGDPRQLAQTRTGSDGRFEITSQDTLSADVSLYLVAKGGEVAVNRGSGDNPAIAFLTVLGSTPPATVVVNEMTTVASVWTNAQFLDGAAIKGHALGIKIAAGNVPNFVDLQTGGWGTTIQDPLNGSQTPTMANFATLADLLSGCATRVKADACIKLFAAAMPPTGVTATDTLTAAQSIARYSGYKPERLFALLSEFYPVPQGKDLRPVPFMPYLNFAPSAWVLPLKFDGGGFRAGGKAMFDSEAISGSATTSRWDGRRRIHFGKAMQQSSLRTVVRFRRSPRASLAAECRAGPLARQLMLTTTPGCPAMAASRSLFLTRTASH
jgi:hypothetical protein